MDVVTVSIEFLGTVRLYTLYLKKEALQDLPTITSTQYAQQGELGTKIRYDLELERLARTDQSFSLIVLDGGTQPRGLPALDDRHDPDH